jgi:dienelactone hydrolase
MRHLITGFVLLLASTLTLAAKGTTVTYTVDGQEYEGYYISPNKKAPLVVIIHDWDGMGEYEMKRAEMLAKKGYAVFAADLFGKGVAAETVDQRRALTGALYQDRDKMRSLMRGALDAAKAQGANVDNSVAAGYCFGGAAVLEWARSGDNMKGFVTFHGGLTTPEGQSYSQTKGDIMVLHGTADTSVTMEHFASLAAELESTGIKHEMVTYSGAPHAFTVFGSSRYREDADLKSWDRFMEFLDTRLK